jgi:phage tail-like protein
MARPIEDDPYQNFRFHVWLHAAGTNEKLTDWLKSTGSAAAGFNACSMPSFSLESVEYKEGTEVYKRKFPGVPTFDQVTLSRGVTRKSDYDMFSWIQAAARGNPYRYDMTIRHFHRQDVNPEKAGFQLATNSQASRIIRCFNVFPSSYKPSGDFDATSSEVSLQELTVELERFEVIYPSALQ